MAVSPDGQRLAAVSDLGHAGNDLVRWRLFVGDVTTGKMQAVTSPARQVGPACWTADGKLLIYARNQQPMPPDCWANTDGFFRATDLFQYDLAAKKEMRLSRGGGFLSPSLGADDTLYYLTAKPDSNFRSRPRVLKTVLTGAQRFGKSEPELPMRDAAVLDHAAGSRLQRGPGSDRRRWGSAQPGNPQPHCRAVRQNLQGAIPGKRAGNRGGARPAVTTRDSGPDVGPHAARPLDPGPRRGPGRIPAPQGHGRMAPRQRPPDRHG